MLLRRAVGRRGEPSSSVSWTPPRRMSMLAGLARPSIPRALVPSLPPPPLAPSLASPPLGAPLSARSSQTSSPIPTPRRCASSFPHPLHNADSQGTTDPSTASSCGRSSGARSGGCRAAAGSRILSAAGRGAQRLGRRSSGVCWVLSIESGCGRRTGS